MIPIPRLRMTRAAAAIRPKIAPEAPTVGPAVTTSAPNDPASRDTK